MNAGARILITAAAACPLVVLLARRSLVPRGLAPAVSPGVVQLEARAVPTGLQGQRALRRAADLLPPELPTVELLPRSSQPVPVPDRAVRLAELRQLERAFREADREDRPLLAFRADTLAVAAILDHQGRSAPCDRTAEPIELPGDLRSFTYRGREYRFHASEFGELEVLRAWLTERESRHESGPPPVWNAVQRRVDEAAALLSRP